MATEKHEAWWAKEAQDRIMAMRNVKLAIAFVGLNVLDAVLTLAAMIQGELYELNPIMRKLLEQPGWMFWGFKIVAAIVCASLLLLLAAKYPRQIKRILTVLVVVMLGVCLVNTIGLA